jgi:RNA 3'-terminal phosphate cyclase (ATP)
MLVIDGSTGEGGGQILRSSLSLSAILERPVRIVNIRAARPKPGLRPQHLTGLTAIADITRAKVSGAKTGSTEVVFEPGPVRPGRYVFDVSRTTSSAGSVTLVMQTLLPALLHAPGASTAVVRGGTHVAWSPPFHFLSECFIPAVGRIGADAGADIARWGWYPKGGGEASLSVRPLKHLGPVELVERGGLLRVEILSAVSNLPLSIAKRQAATAGEYLRASGIEPSVEIMEAPSYGTGTFVYVSAQFENISAGFSALGERGKRAEAVGKEAASALSRFMGSGACVEEHLADQLVLYMAVADGVSRMSVPRITRHLLTNIEVVRMFLPDIDIRVDGIEDGPGTVEVAGGGLL